MPISAEDKVVINHYRIEKNYSAAQLLSEFPEKNWTRGGLDYLLHKIDETGSVDRKKGSGRPKSVRTESNIEEVNELILSQENAPSSHSTPREISRTTGISRTSVRRIIKEDLNLTPYKRINSKKLNDGEILRRMTKGKKILRKMTLTKVAQTFFIDEKVFTVNPPKNSQNNRVYANVNKKAQISPRRLCSEK